MINDAEGRSPVEPCSLFVEAEADPAALPRILGFLQVVNVVPHRVLAELGTHGVLAVRIEVRGIDKRKLDLITAKIGQVPCVLGAACSCP
jgi:hypothetical protein